MKKKTVLEHVDYITKTIGDSVQYSIANIGSSFLPIVSGLSYAVGIYTVFHVITDSILIALVMTVLTAIGLESVGFNTSKNMIASPSFATITLFVGYILIGGLTLWLMEIDRNHAMITSSVFGLTVINYISYGFKEKVRKVVDKEEELKLEEERKEQLEYDRKIEAKKLNWQMKQKAKKIDNDLVSNVGSQTDKATNQNDKQTDKTTNDKTNSTVNVRTTKRYNQLSEKELSEIGQMTTKEVAEIYPISDRTALRWIKKTKGEL